MTLAHATDASNDSPNQKDGKELCNTNTSDQSCMRHHVEHQNDTDYI